MAARVFTPDQTLYALNWKAPYSELMTYGKVETRTWDTNYRGWVLMCASKKPYTFDEMLGISGWLQTGRISRTLGLPPADLEEELRKPSMIKTGVAFAIGYLAATCPMNPQDEDLCFVQYQLPLWLHIYEDVQEITPFAWVGSQKWRKVSDEIKNSIVIR